MSEKNATQHTPAAKKPQSSRARRSAFLRRMTLTAIFAACAVVLKAYTNLALTIPGAGIKVGASGIFTFFPAILCGPIWGGIASACSDIFGYMIAPDGAYVPWYTLTAFLGGFAKGLIWKLLDRKASNRVRTVLLAICVVLSVLGAAVGISLTNDGVTASFITVQSELPTRAEIEEMELSPLSSFAVGLAQYNKDTLTMTEVTGEDRVLPSALTLDGYSVSLSSKLNSGVLAGVTGRITIPANYKTIASDVFGDSDTSLVTIVTVEGSAASSFAQSNGIACETIPELAAPVFELTLDELSENGISFKTGDNYRKYLCTYTNLAGFGLLLGGILGVVFIGLNILMPYITSAINKNKESASEKPKTDKGGSAAYMRIAIAATVSGLIVTTLNTFILLATTMAGRAFWVVYIPRFAEELAVCLLQAYIISLLYGIVVRGRVKTYIDKLG